MASSFLRAEKSFTALFAMYLWAEDLRFNGNAADGVRHEGVCPVEQTLSKDTQDMCWQHAHVPSAHADLRQWVRRQLPF